MAQFTGVNFNFIKTHRLDVLPSSELLEERA
jgi:hypothetical protein